MPAVLSGTNQTVFHRFDIESFALENDTDFNAYLLVFALRIYI